MVTQPPPSYPNNSPSTQAEIVLTDGTTTQTETIITDGTTTQTETQPMPDGSTVPAVAGWTVAAILAVIVIVTVTVVVVVLLR